MSGHSGVREGTTLRAHIGALRAANLALTEAAQEMYSNIAEHLVSTCARAPPRHGTQFHSPIASLDHWSSDQAEISDLGASSF